MEWATRIALALLATMLGYHCVTFSLAQAIASDAPDVAHRLAPYDGRITGRLAASLAPSLAAPEATSADRRRVERLAKDALRRDPTAVPAVAALGLVADLGGDKAAPRRYFTYAQTLSRREKLSQLWWIEDAVARGSIAEALMHYDIVLRVSPEMSELLYPVLASASADPAIRMQLIRKLAEKPEWAERFIIYAATNSADPRAAAALLAGLAKGGVPVPEAARAETVNALLAGGHFEQAWSYYTTFHRNADRRRSRDADFKAGLKTPSLLDWVTINDGGVITTIDEGVFAFAAPASMGGSLVQQAELLPPGRYRLTGHSDGIAQPAGALPYWSLTCRADGRELGRVIVPSSSTANGRFTGDFTVPDDCPAQMLTLIGRPSDAVGGLSGQIDQLALEPSP